MSDIAPFADGSEQHLPDRPVKGSNVNLDRDDEIYQNTEKSGGKWRYRNIEGKVIAETDAPSEVNASIISQWGAAVRARATREHNTMRREDMEGVTDGGVALPDGVSRDDVQPAATVVAGDTGDSTPAPSVDDDPDGYVSSKITAAQNRLQAISIKRAELQEQIEQLDEEKATALKEYEKWKRMKEAINAEI